MYAIVESGGRQWRVEPGSQLLVNRLGGEVGSQHVIERVLLASDGRSVRVGQPYLPDARVLCEVLEHRKGPKTITYKFRRRENYRRTRGHRQPLTTLLVKDIELSEVRSRKSEIRSQKTEDRSQTTDDRSQPEAKPF